MYGLPFVVYSKYYIMTENLLKSKSKTGRKQADTRAIDKVATDRGSDAASACDPPRISVHSSSSNLRTLKRHKCRDPWRCARNFVSNPEADTADCRRRGKEALISALLK